MLLLLLLLGNGGGAAPPLAAAAAAALAAINECIASMLFLAIGGPLLLLNGRFEREVAGGRNGLNAILSAITVNQTFSRR